MEAEGCSVWFMPHRASQDLPAQVRQYVLRATNVNFQGE